MIIRKKDRSYITHKKHIQGKGFVDSLSSTLKNVGSYIYQNKDLLAKPMLGAVGNLAALGLTEGGKKLLTHIMNKNNKTHLVKPLAPLASSSQFSTKDLETLQNIISGSSETPTSGSASSTTNIIGSGIKKF